MDRKELLLTYLSSNVAPVLVDFIFGDDLENAIVLPANIDTKELCGHYEGENFVPPKWFDDLKNKKGSKTLVIDKIDSISKDQQTKFLNILDARKVSNFKLPDDCVIIVTAKDISKETINKEILSFVAII